MSRRFQFSLQWPFAVLAGSVVGGQTARSLNSWSARGEVVIFCIGCIAALGGIAVMSSAPAALRVRSPWRGPNTIRRMVTLLASTSVVGCLSGGGAIVALAWLAIGFGPVLGHDFFDFFAPQP